MEMLSGFAEHKVRIISGIEYDLEEKINAVIAEEYAEGKVVKQIISLGDSAEVDPEDTSSIRVPMPMVMILFEVMPETEAEQ